MGTYPKEPINRRSTYWRNELRKHIARLVGITKDDLSGLEDNVVTTATVADGAITEGKIGAAAVSVAKCKFPLTGVNLLPKKYTSFSALESTVPSADLYVVSGSFVSLYKTVTNKYLGSHSVQIRPSSGTQTMAFCTGASDYPIPPVESLGTYFILSHYYMRNLTAGLTYVIQLRYSDSSTQTISGTVTPTTTRQRFISDPFAMNSPMLASRIELVVTSSSSQKSLFLTEQMLVCTGNSASVTEPGPWIPGAVEVADEVDNRTVRLTESRYLFPFVGNAYNGGAALDTAVVDTNGRIVTLRQTSADLSVANLLHEDGSGVEKDNALIDFKIGSGKKITVGSQDIIDASGNFAVASGKKITVGAQDVIDASGNLSVASGKTFSVGAATIINSSGVIQSRRTLAASFAESLSGGATYKEATTASTTYVTIWDGAIYVNADERVELNCELWDSATFSYESWVQLDVNGVTNTAHSSNNASEWDKVSVIVNPSGSGLLVFKVQLKTTNALFTAKLRYWVLDGMFS